jgi:diguanylate cyclase (GGDEF)-like protein/PAS domain S-box-containing protein
MTTPALSLFSGIPVYAMAMMLMASLFASLLLFRLTHRLVPRRTGVPAAANPPVPAHLMRAVGALNDVIWTIEMPGGRVAYVSPGVERVLQRTAEEYYASPTCWINDIHPDDRGMVIGAAERISTSSSETLQFRAVLPDGTIRWMHCRAYFTPGPVAGTGWIDGITTDITEQRATREALRRNNRALKAIRACDAIVANARNERDLFQGICDVITAAGYENAWAGIMDPAAPNGISPLGAAGNEYRSPDQIAAALHSGSRCASTISRMVQTPMRVITEGDHGLRKIAIPLLQDELMTGLLSVHTAESDAFDDDEAELLCGLAQSLMVALQSLRRRDAIREAEAALHLRQRAIEACANPIAITSAGPQRLVEYVNPAYERVTGYAASDIIGSNLELLSSDEQDQPGLYELRAAFDERREAHAVVREYRKDGSLLWSDIYVAPVRDDAGIVTHMVSARYDITALKQYQEELAFLVNYDAVTGLANRHLLHDRIGQAIAHADRYRHSIWVMMLDLDNFKFINDSLGYPAGDQTLKQIAGVLRAAVRQTDTVARISGDKFVLMMSEVGKGSLPAISVAERLMQAIQQPLSLNGVDYFLTCAIGIALYPDDGKDADTLISHADTALHRAKEQKHSGFQFYAPSMNERVAERLRLQGDLRGALQRNEFVLHYQPQVNLRTGRIVGMEALLRWQHPELGLISPASFIGIAEDTGLIIPIGIWVLRSACAQVRKLHDAGHSGLRVAVNLSARQFMQADLVPSIEAVLQETGLDARYLDIELTEGMVMTDIEHAIETLHRLKALGIKLSIDDFGTGYSSLSYLNRFPVDYLKIDRSFMHNITSDPAQSAIVLAIISLAHSLRLEVVSEGVETEEQLNYLLRNHCDQIQGYFFSRPLPAASFEQIVEEGKRLPGGEHAITPPAPTILILDDEVLITAALSRLLRHEDYRVLRAHTPEEAFSLLALHEVQVVLSDQLMPTMNGTQFISRVKDLYPDTIRMVLTGYTAVSSVIEAINSGAVFRFHTKPWDDDALCESIAEAFRLHWLRSRQRHPAALPAPPGNDEAQDAA